MANAQPGGDVSQRGPGEYLDPFAPLSSQFQQLKSILEFVFDDPDEFLHNLNEDVLALPPEERFTQSHEVLMEHVEDRFGGPNAFVSMIPELSQEKLPAFLEQVFDQLLTDVLEGVLFRRDPEENLVLATLVRTLTYSLQRLSETEEQNTRNRSASTMLALLSRIQHTLVDTPGTLPDEAIWDAVYGLYYVTLDDDETNFRDPKEMSFDEAKQEVLQFGAVVAYARLQISLSRGAELAGVTPDEFQVMLDRFNVQPRFGPNTVEALNVDKVDE